MDIPLDSSTKPHRTKPHQLFSVKDKTPLFNLLPLGQYKSDSTCIYDGHVLVLYVISTI